MPSAGRCRPAGVLRDTKAARTSNEEPANPNQEGRDKAIQLILRQTPELVATH
jgi:hypothetical protein